MLTALIKYLRTPIKALIQHFFLPECDVYSYYRHYKALLGSDCTEEEQYHSATGLYTLAFNEVCRKAILKDDALVKGS